MDPPLTLELLRLTPATLVPGLVPATSSAPVPATAAPSPPLPDGFALSTTSNYPAPYGAVSLGERLCAVVRLANPASPGGDLGGDVGERRGSGPGSGVEDSGSGASPSTGVRVPPGSVRGAKMMLEVQTPGGRYRLGEVIHGEESRPEGREPAAAEERQFDDLPALAPGASVQMQVGHEFTEMGVHIFICSVAWETPEGRRTFQRFLKFTVNAPLAIKTRVHTPAHVSALLDPVRRGEVYLEVLLQNVSPYAMAFGDVQLEAVPGMRARSVGADGQDETGGDGRGGAGVPEAEEREGERKGSGTDENGSRAVAPDAPSLLPGDTTQRLFILTPTDGTDSDTPGADQTSSDAVPRPPSPPAAIASLPLSSFPPTYAAGTVLPLGRLALEWVSGAHREPGVFQTSMLNRRVPVVPIAGSRPSSVLGTPIGPAPRSRPVSLQLAARPGWEFDLVLPAPAPVPAEDEFVIPLRLAVRSAPITDESAAPPPPLALGVQIITATPPAPPPVRAPTPSGPSVPSAPPTPTPSRPQVAILPPSRSTTPARPGSPASISRPMTPVSAQLRHAAVSSIASSPWPTRTPTPPPSTPPVASAALEPAFPPPPVADRPTKRFSTMTLGPTANLSLPSSSASAAPQAPTGRVVPLGASLVAPTPADWVRVRDRPGTTYAAEIPGTTVHARWEASYDVPLHYAALAPGLAELGGVRVLLLDAASSAREWESVGEVWVDEA